ncbi:MAG: response regulator transcription factor [Roseburia sp.]|nr:response regulator transcription factor [Roseburia sp.]
MIKVMLADDHNLIREGIRQLLELDEGIEVVMEASDGMECLEKVASIKPDVLLLDINMPTKNGIEVLEEIKKSRIRTRVLILTVHNTIEYLMKAVDLDVDGYLLKEVDFSELREAIYSLARGDKYIQSSLIPLLNNKLIVRDQDKDLIDTLTKRELEVLVLITKGMFNKEIAIKLNISERTVKNHISNIFKKIGVSDRTQAAVFAIKNDLIKL